MQAADVASSAIPPSTGGLILCGALHGFLDILSEVVHERYLTDLGRRTYTIFGA
jgi:hypothetical protein